MKNLLVTGGAGFIGSNFVIYMLDKYADYNIIVYDKLTYAGNLDNLLGVADDPRYHFVQGIFVTPPPSLLPSKHTILTPLSILRLKPMLTAPSWTRMRLSRPAFTARMSFWK